MSHLFSQLLNIGSQQSLTHFKVPTISNGGLAPYASLSSSVTCHTVAWSQRRTDPCRVNETALPLRVVVWI